LFRYSISVHPVRMATLPKKIEVETKAREMLEREGVPPPDRVEYGYGCIRLFWSESKLVLVIDIDDYSEVDAKLGIETH
jgi:hypothetical protein